MDLTFGRLPVALLRISKLKNRPTGLFGNDRRIVLSDNPLELMMKEVLTMKVVLSNQLLF